jgi:hypothetical protein
MKKIYDPNKFLRRMAWVAGALAFWAICALIPGASADGEFYATPYALLGATLTIIGVTVLADYLWERK